MSMQLDAALAMAKRGFRVFPLRVYGKRPAISAFQNAATCDENIIRAWWNHEPRYNVGVLTTDLVVVDIDVKYVKDAVNEYLTHGGHFDTLVVKTPTGGYHCYFSGPISKLAAGIFPGVDIRAYNGYVVGPGSVVDANLSGEDNIKATGEYVIEHDNGVGAEYLPWVPLGLECKLEKPGVRVRLDFSVELDTTTAISNATEWLKAAEPAIEGMGGDNRTYETAAKLVRDFALSPETAFQLLWQNWNDHCIPPWPEHELWHKVENAVAYGKGPLGAARPEAYFGSVQLVPVPQLVPATQEQDDLIPTDDLLDIMNVGVRPWLIERLMLMEDVTVLAGTGSAGKSIFILTAICHFASGQDFGPYKLKEKRPLRFLIYNAEDSLKEQSRRVIAICYEFKLNYELVQSNVKIINKAKHELTLARTVINTPIAEDNVINGIIKTAKHKKIDAIVFDPMVNLHNCNENDNGQMRFVMSIFNKIASETETAVFVLHHTTKGSSKEIKGDPDIIRGASAIINSARISLMVSSVTDEDRREMNIGADEHHAYFRIDDAKTNIYLKSKKATMYLMLHSVKIATGDIVGIPKLFSAKDKMVKRKQDLAIIIITELRKRCKSSMPLKDAIEVLQQEDELCSKEKDITLRRHINKWFKEPVEVNDERVVAKKEGELWTLWLI
jgi:RecA-family ATPase